MKKVALFLILACSTSLSTSLNGQVVNNSPPVKTAYDLNTLSTDTLRPDTLTNLSHIYHPLYTQFPFWFDLGNVGLPALPAYWNGLTNLNTPHYLESLKGYFGSISKLNFYETYAPYALLFYSSGGSEDINGQVIQATFAKHISPQLQVTANLDFISSPGHYSNQNASHSDFYVNARYSKNRYKLTAGVESSSWKLGENGGLTEPIDYPWNSSGASSLPVNLSDAASNTNWLVIKGRQEFALLNPKPVSDNENTADSLLFDRDSVRMMADSLFQQDTSTLNSDLLMHTDTIGMDSTDSLAVTGNPFRVFHSFVIQRSKRQYVDNQVATGGFYDEYFYSGEESSDSMSHFHIMNRFGVSDRKEPGKSTILTLQAGIDHHLMNWRSNNYQVIYQQVEAYASSSGIVGSWKTNAQVNVRLLGPGIGAYTLLAEGSKVQDKSKWQYAGRIGSNMDLPGISYMMLVGNHDLWLKRMRMQSDHFVDIDVMHKPTGIKLSSELHIVSHWAYFDKDAQAAQTDYSTVYSNLSIQKWFRAGPFNSKNLFFLQYSPAKEIPLPLAVVSSTNFMHHDFFFSKTNGKLELEYGIDLRYVSPYTGYAYQPSTSAFYLRDGNYLGNYPFLDLFLTARVKRTRIFIKWEHFNGGYTGIGFFPVENYPIKVQFLKYGVYWHFYD